MNGVGGAVHVGAPVKPLLSVIGEMIIRLLAVTAVVFTVYVAVVVGTTTVPLAADPHAAGETTLPGLQLVAVLYVLVTTPLNGSDVVPNAAPPEASGVIVPFVVNVLAAAPTARYTSPAAFPVPKISFHGA